MSAPTVRDVVRNWMPTRYRALPILLLWLAACGERAGEARLLLQDIAAGRAPSELKATTPVPMRRQVVWRMDGRDGIGDLYVSPDGALARMVLVPGLTEQGPDDPRMVALARSLARMRFAVLVPDIANLRRLRVDPEDARSIADAAIALTGMGAAGARSSPVGLAAVSYAVGPALIAALEPDAAQHIGFLVAIGGYYDMTAVVTYLTTDRYRAEQGGDWLPGRPHALAKWRFVAVNAERLGSPADRIAFAEIADRRIADPAAHIDDLAVGFEPDGRALLALLENRDPDAVPELIAAMPADLRSTFSGLSPSAYDLGSLSTRLILIHGRDDPAVPYTESIALAAAMPPGQSALFLLDGLDHVEFRSELAFSDQLVLLEAGAAVLAERDRIAVRHSADPD